MQQRTVWVVLMTFRQSEKPGKVGEFSKETKIADGHNYPGAQCWAGGGRFRCLECSISAKTNPVTAAAAYYSITQAL